MTSRQVYIDATNGALGVLAAKERGDDAAVAALVASFDDATLASGSLIAAELLLSWAATATGVAPLDLIGELALQVEARFPDPPA
jgi:hypothetical protein